MFSNEKLIFIPVLVLWIMFLLRLLGNTAECYLSPILGVICIHLKIPYAIAGITFLAFANGAPDAFSALASFRTQEDVLGLGAILGGCLFIITVVTAVVCISHPCIVKNSAAFIRNILFMISATFLTGYITVVQSVSIVSSLSFFALYIMYCFFSLIYFTYDAEEDEKLMKIVLALDAESSQKQWSLDDWQTHVIHSYFIFEEDNVESDVVYVDFNPFIPAEISNSSRKSDDEHWQDDPDSLKEPFFKNEESSSNPVTNESHVKNRSFTQYLFYLQNLWWIHRESACEPYLLSHLGTGLETIDRFRIICNKIVTIIDFPLSLMRRLTIPTIDRYLWYKPYALVQTISMPFLLMTVSGLPRCVPVLIAGAVMSLSGFFYMYFFEKYGSPPRSPAAVTIWLGLGFAMSVVWVYGIAAALVAAISQLGHIVGIAPAYLGLTFLAWGNSVSDLVSNVAVAKQGLVEMALAACHGGPVFNILVGLGLPLVFAAVKSYPEPYTLQPNLAVSITLIFIFAVLVLTLFVAYARSYSVGKELGYFLLIAYTSYVVVQIILLALQVT